jgi:hypothetical protein
MVATVATTRLSNIQILSLEEEKDGELEECRPLTHLFPGCETGKTEVD